VKWLPARQLRGGEQAWYHRQSGCAVKRGEKEGQPQHPNGLAPSLPTPCTHTHTFYIDLERRSLAVQTSNGKHLSPHTRLASRLWFAVARQHTRALHNVSIRLSGRTPGTGTRPGGQHTTVYWSVALLLSLSLSLATVPTHSCRHLLFAVRTLEFLRGPLYVQQQQQHPGMSDALVTCDPHGRHRLMAPYPGGLCAQLPPDFVSRGLQIVPDPSATPPRTCPRIKQHTPVERPLVRAGGGGF